MKRLTRLFLAGGSLWACLAFAQTGSVCLDRCGASMTDCVGNCGSETKCTSECMKRYDDCSTRCVAGGKAGGAHKGAGKQQKCPGPKGKDVPCSSYVPPPDQK